jgi:hypothetical protein
MEVVKPGLPYQCHSAFLARITPLLQGKGGHSLYFKIVLLGITLFNIAAADKVLEASSTQQGFFSKPEMLLLLFREDKYTIHPIRF